MKPPPIYIAEDGGWWAMEGHEDRRDFILEVWDMLADHLELYHLEDDEKADEVDRLAKEARHAWIRPGGRDEYEDPEHVFECGKEDHEARPATVWQEA